MEKIKVAAISMCSTDNVSQNIKTASSWIQKAAEEGAHWIQLPEVFSYCGPPARLWDHAEYEGSRLLTELSENACKYKIVLFAGSIPYRKENGNKKVYNTSFIFGRQGQILAEYRKIHLFQLQADKEGCQRSHQDVESRNLGTHHHGGGRRAHRDSPSPSSPLRR